MNYHILPSIHLHANPDPDKQLASCLSESFRSSVQVGRKNWIPWKRRICLHKTRLGIHEIIIHIREPPNRSTRFRDESKPHVSPRGIQQRKRQQPSGYINKADVKPRNFLSGDTSVMKHRRVGKLIDPPARMRVDRIQLLISTREEPLPHRFQRDFLSKNEQECNPGSFSNGVFEVCGVSYE